MVLVYQVLDIVSLSAAGLALILAIVSLSLHRKRRLELAKGLGKKRLSSKLSWVTARDAPNGTIRLDIWNAGRASVHLKKVQLMWGEDNKETRETVSKLGFLPYDPIKESVMKSTFDDALSECEGRTFILPPLPPGMMQRPASQPAEKIWVAVEDVEGEVHRLSGDMVLPLLRNFLEPVAAERNS
ncbi:MAG: hypothetical protein Q7N50_02565 [Armatimonadota bacterium]|nr:hypothetical protein [Armatimonadota bacterium]